MDNNYVSCKLRISKHEGKTPAFLASFTNGCVNLKNSDQLKFTCFRESNDGEDAPRKNRILCAHNKRLKYRSSPYDHVSHVKNRYQYNVGLRNKISGKMKVYDGLSFLLSPDIKREISTATREVRSWKERADELTSSFGSKDMKRSMVARQKYSTDTTSLDDTLENLNLNDSENISEFSIPSIRTSTGIEYIPPQNLEAEHAEHVYNISDIIPPDVDAYLTEKANEMLQNLPDEISQWKAETTCEYILKHLDNELGVQNLKLLLYFHYLVKFSHVLRSDLNKKDPISDIPEPIRSNLLDCFTEQGVGRARNFPPKMKDKLLSFIIVLALFIDDFSVNLNLLQSGMKFGLKKTSDVAQAVGCHVVARRIDNSSFKFAELKLPLFVFKKYYKK